jgi:hypothetical protein
MRHKAWDGRSWRPAAPQGESVGNEAVFTSPPVAVSWGTGRLDIFEVAADGAINHMAWDGSSWQPPVWESLGGFIADAPAVMSWAANRLDIFGLGADSGMYHKAWTGRNWQPANPEWERIGDGTFIGGPVAVSWGPNRLDVFGIGDDKAVYHMAWAGSSWQPPTWERLGGQVRLT